jgi:hypothetical protein
MTRKTLPIGIRPRRGSRDGDRHGGDKLIARLTGDAMKDRVDGRPIPPIGMQRGHARRAAGAFAGDRPD